MMSRSVAFLVAIAAAGTVHAQMAPDGPTPSGQVIAIDPSRVFLDRAYDTAQARRAAQSSTAVDYRLGRDGAFGQVGYVCRSDGSPIAEQEAAIHMDAKDDRLLGATLKYHF